MSTYNPLSSTVFFQHIIWRSLHLMSALLFLPHGFTTAFIYLWKCFSAFFTAASQCPHIIPSICIIFFIVLSSFLDLFFFFLAFNFLSFDASYILKKIQSQCVRYSQKLDKLMAAAPNIDLISTRTADTTHQAARWDSDNIMEECPEQILVNITECRTAHTDLLRAHRLINTSSSAQHLLPHRSQHPFRPRSAIPISALVGLRRIVDGLSQEPSQLFPSFFFQLTDHWHTSLPEVRPITSSTPACCPMVLLQYVRYLRSA